MENSLFKIERLKRAGHFTMEEDEIHDFYELYYLLHGERRYFIHDINMLVQARDLIWIPPHILHRTLDTGKPDHERILLQFHGRYLRENLGIDPDLMLSALSASRRLTPDVKEQELIEFLLNQMIAESRKPDHSTPLYLASLLTQLLIQVRRIAEKTSEKSPEQPTVWEGMIHYMHEHFASPLTLTDISKHFYMSPYHVSRKFSQYTGFQFTEYLVWLRIKKARELLAETNLRIVDVAHESGFNNLAHFQRVFKRLLRCTPLQYRKLHAAKKE
ncbi:helix-turn-helix transcriptional regulator [Paenibacillus sp. CAU 1782]